MSRPPLEPGKWGRIRRTQVGPHAWIAHARIRDLDGVTRKAQKKTPDHIVDRLGAVAERLLVEDLEKRVTPVEAHISAHSTIRELWHVHRERLIIDEKAQRTIDRYDDAVTKILTAIGAVRIREVTPQRVGIVLTSIDSRHGRAEAKTCRSILSGMFRMAVVEFGTGERNPVGEFRFSATKRDKSTPRALTGDELRALLAAVRNSELPITASSGSTRVLRAGETVSEYCRRCDLADAIHVFAGTGLRIAELLGLKWSGIDFDNKIAHVNGKVSYHKGVGLVYEDFLKASDRHSVELPEFVVATLLTRKVEAIPNQLDLVFPSSVGTMRYPENFNKSWRRVRDILGFDWVTAHTFRRTVATSLGDAGLSAEVAADVLNHAKSTMTQDKYMARKRTHRAAADALDALVAVRKNAG